MPKAEHLFYIRPLLTASPPVPLNGTDDDELRDGKSDRPPPLPLLFLLFPLEIPRGGAAK